MLTLFRYADQIAIGDEVLVTLNYRLEIAKVIKISSFVMKGNIYILLNSLIQVIDVLINFGMEKNTGFMKLLHLINFCENCVKLFTFITSHTWNHLL